MMLRFSGLLEELQIYYVLLINVYLILAPTFKKVNLKNCLCSLLVQDRKPTLKFDLSKLLSIELPKALSLLSVEEFSPDHRGSE